VPAIDAVNDTIDFINDRFSGNVCYFDS